LIFTKKEAALMQIFLGFLGFLGFFGVNFGQKSAFFVIFYPIF
jgi:hypothetical protein